MKGNRTRVLFAERPEDEVLKGPVSFLFEKKDRRRRRDREKRGTRDSRQGEGVYDKG